MKILQAIYQFRTGGGSLQVVTNLAKAAREAGHSVTVLSKDVAISSEVGGERFFTGNKMWDWYRLMNHLHQQRYDIVHVHDRYCAFLLSLIPTQRAASVQTNHFAYSTHRGLTRFAQCVVGCSQAMDRHHADFFRLPASRRAMIQNGVYFREPKAELFSQLRQSLPASLRDRALCLTVGRLERQKGHTYLLQALAKLSPPIRQGWGFIFAGSGDLETTLRTEAQELGIADDVCFLGHTNAVSEWLALSQAFVLPSLYEGLPLALLEAMAVGLPCLASNIQGTTEALVDHHNGLLFRSQDPTDLAEKLEHLLTNKVLAQQFGAQARQDYQRYWTFDRTWQQYEALYEQLIQAHPKQRDSHDSFYRFTEKSKV